MIRWFLSAKVTFVSVFWSVSLWSGPTLADEVADSAPVIVMLGDSTTDQGLPWVVQKQLDQEIAASFGRKNMINAGKGGDNATAALDRLRKDVLAHKPDIVTVSFGLNDTGGRKPKQYRESVNQIVATLKAAGIKVVLMTSTPFNNDLHPWGKKEEFQKLGGLDEYLNREFCEQMRTIAKEQEIPLCDLHQIFKAEFARNPGAINKLISKDGVHLTGDGLDLMAQHIVPILKKMLTDEEE